MADPSTILFVGGGTGGHLKPGLVLLAALRRAHPDWRLRMLVSGRAVERSFLDDGGPASRLNPDEVVELFPGCDSRPALWRLDQYMSGLARARAATVIHGHRPDLMVLLGGYVAAMAVLAAPRVNTVLLEPDCVPGKAARLAERRARRIFDQWPDTLGRPESAPRRMVTGMPISWASLPDRAAARAKLGLAPTLPTLVVIGGSQGAHAVNLAMMRSLPRLQGAPRNWQCLHLAGPRDRDAVEQAYREAGIRAAVLAFHSRMEVAYAAADLVVSRAGGMTVAELAAAGRAAMLIPYPHHRDQHQYANAQRLAEAGAGWIVPEAELGDGFLAERVLPLLQDSNELRSREASAARLGRPDATQRIVDEIEALVWKRGRECKTVGDGFISSELAEVG